MFRRHWSGLPKDAEFASDLKGLGYFVNDQDEIRSIENPDCYFKFFINKNARTNERQRFSFNRALEVIVQQRLEKTGLQKLTLPLGTSPSEPHVPILTSTDLKQTSRIVVIFGEPVQDLGILAGRVANGPGGIDRGTMVSVVKALQKQEASDDDASRPGIVLANMGQLWWWPEEKRAITIHGSAAVPLSSLVHAGKRYVPAVNDIPGNENPSRHVEYVLNEFLPTVMRDGAKLDLICIGSSCQTVERFLDVDENWNTWEGKLSAMLLIGSVYSVESLGNDSLKEFLAKRTRGYLISPEPLDTPLASPTGNPNDYIEPLGCPSFSSSEPYYTETILIAALDPALAYLQEVARTGASYENAPVVVTERPCVDMREVTDAAWGTVPEDEKPSVSVADKAEMKAQVKQLRRWDKFEKTNVLPDSDSDESSDGGL